MVVLLLKTETLALNLLPRCTRWWSTTLQIVCQPHLWMFMDHLEIHTSFSSLWRSWTTLVVSFKSLNTLFKFLTYFEFIIGHAEHYASLTEGMATALHCFKDLTALRDPGLTAHKFCILICNSPPYALPVCDVPGFEGMTLEQLASNVSETGIQFSLISPRRIPTWVFIN